MTAVTGVTAIATAAASVTEKVCVREQDAIRLIIEFLSRRELCITQLSLERESGVYNCNYSDDLIFLRQLILDGQWNDALQFVSPLEPLETFAAARFRFLIHKHKYVELLCIRAEASGSAAAVEVGVQDIIECLAQIETCCADRQEYNRLSALLTIPNLSDDDELRHWNPNSWRLKCFRDVMPLVEKFLQPNPVNDSSIAKNDRLMNLIFKGLMYELCLDAVANKLERKDSVVPKHDPDVMNGVKRGGDYNLHCFLQSLPENLLDDYFGDKPNKRQEAAMNLDIEKHDKPQLVASWSEMILSAPIKPNIFPHISVPYTRIKATDLMSKSLTSSLMQNTNAKDLMTMSVCDIAQFSRSTLAATGFHLADADVRAKQEMEKRSLPPNCDNRPIDVMTASMDRLFKTADVFSVSKGLIVGGGSGNSAHAEQPTSSNMSTIRTLETIKEANTPTENSRDKGGFDLPSVQLNATKDEHDEKNDDTMSASYLDIFWKKHPQHQKPKNKSQICIDDRDHVSLQSKTTPPSNRNDSLSLFKPPISANLAAKKNYSALSSPPLHSSDRTPSIMPTAATSNSFDSVSSSSSSISSTNSAIHRNIESTTAAAAATATDRVALNQVANHNSSIFTAATPLSGGDRRVIGKAAAPFGNPTTVTKVVTPIVATTNTMQSKQQQPQQQQQKQQQQQSPLLSDDKYSLWNDSLRNSPIEKYRNSGGDGGNRNSSSNHYLHQHHHNYSTSSSRSNSIATLQSEKHGPRSSFSSPTPSSQSSHRFDLSTGAATSDTDIAGSDVQFVPIAKFDDQQAIRTADFHPSGRYFAIGSNSKLLRVFQYSSQDSNNNAADSICDIPPPELIYKRPKYHKGSIYCLTWNKLGNLLATGSNDKSIKLIGFQPDTRSFHSEIELNAHDGTIRDLCFMDDLTNGSSLLLSGGAGDCKINITDCETATPFLSLSGHSGPILSLYTWGGAMFVSGSQDRTIRFWDLRSNSCINFVTCPTISRTKPGGAVASVCVDPTGKLLVSGHEDSTCMLYDIRGGRVIQTFHPHTADIRTTRFSSKAYYLLSGGYDNRIMLTDLQGDLTQPLKSVMVAEHDDKVIQCRWHPVDFTFLSTSADKSAILWALPD